MGACSKARDEKARSTSRQKAAKQGEDGSSGAGTNVELSRSAEVKQQGRQTSAGKSISSSTPKPSEYGWIPSLLMVFTLQMSFMHLINPCLDFDPPRNFFHFDFITPFPAALHPTQSTGWSCSFHTPLYFPLKALCLPWTKIPDPPFPVLTPSLFYWHF